MTVLAIVGLKREAEIVAGSGVVSLASGGVVRTLASRIEAALTPGICGLLSIGIAGALDPGLRLGEGVVASEVVAKERHYRVDAAWADRLAAALPEARRGPIAGSDLPAVDTAAKAALRRSSGALAVDMESHIAAEVAARRGLPFAALRFVSDGADRALPTAALVGMKDDGGMDIVAVLQALARDPGQLPALIRTGLEAEEAFRALFRGRHRLGPALGLADVEGVHLA